VKQELPIIGEPVKMDGKRSSGGLHDPAITEIPDSRGGVIDARKEKTTDAADAHMKATTTTEVN